MKILGHVNWERIYTDDDVACLEKSWGLNSIDIKNINL